jgi:glutathionylspermidine synthase
VAGHALIASALHAGSNLPFDAWLSLQRRAIFDFCKWDIQSEDHSVLAPFPLLLECETASYLNRTAEALAREALAAESEILRSPNLIERLGLPLALKNILQAHAGNMGSKQDVRVMRFDFHPTPAGWRISEVNADVPGGFIEASGWNTLFAKNCSGTSAPPATSEIYARAIREAAGPNGLVAFVHATAYSDDRQVMQFLARRFAGYGMRTCLLSPIHLRWKDGYSEISASFASGRPDAIVRFFPAEWLPNLATGERWKPYFQPSQTPLSNPGSSIILQSKRFSLIWDELRTDLSVWRELLPETYELSEIGTSVDESWVLKPALGRVGEGVGIRGITPADNFQKIVREANRRPHTWVAQERFSILPLRADSGEKYPCIGVFTIGGKAAGFYGRISDSPIITQDAQDAAVLVKCVPEGG